MGTPTAGSSWQPVTLGTTTDAATCLEIPAPGEVLRLRDTDPSRRHKQRILKICWTWFQPHLIVAPDRASVMATIDLEASCKQTWSGRDPLGFTRQRNGSQQNATGPVSTIRDDIDAVVDAIADIHIKPTWLAEQGFVLR